MKFLLLLFLLFNSLNCFAQESKIEFAIYFGNNFKNDYVTIFANGVLLAQNTRLIPTMIAPQSLIIEQDRSNLVVEPYYEQKRIIKKIPVKNSVLKLVVAINNMPRIFTVNLKEGKYLFVNYIFLRLGWRVITLATVNQNRLGPIYI